MAQYTGFLSNCLPYPVFGFPYVVVFPILDNTGALVSGAAGLDSECSFNGDTFADCANEATEIASGSGMYYLQLVSTEMGVNSLSILVKTSTTDAKTTPIVLNPKRLPLITTDTSVTGSANTITLASSALALDDAYTGCAILVLIDGVCEARMITGYVGSTKIATVAQSWVTDSPDNNDTYSIYLPDGVILPRANTTAWNNAQVATPLVAGIPTVQPADQGWRQP